MTICKLVRQLAGVGCLYLTVVLFTATVRAQSTGNASQVPVNPFGAPIRIPNFPQPIRFGLDGGQQIPWSVTLSDSYIFLDQRNKVGGVSFDSNSELIDLALGSNRFGTIVNIAYAYLYATGSSPMGESENLSQSLGSLSILQPFLFVPGWGRVNDCGQGRFAKQLGLNLEGVYGNSWSRTHIPESISFADSSRVLVGDALLDCQLAYFPDRTGPCKQAPDADDYATVFVEISSGIQSTNVRAHSADPFLGGDFGSRQLIYRNLASIDYSFYRRFGVFLSAEWDAPLDSVPGRNARPSYANTAVFTAGLTYNYSPGYHPLGKPIANLLNPKCWSVSVLYSYTAFDPVYETNELQVQISYSF